MEQKLAAVNDLNYVEEPALSVVAQRTQLELQAQKNQYSGGETIIIQVETGSDFVDWCSSWLTLKVTTSAAATLSSGRSTILDMFREVTIRARNGTEILRSPAFNVYSRAVLDYEKDTEWLLTVGSAFGYNSAADDLSGGKEFAIPMMLFADLCRKDQRMPPQLSSGMRIELSLDSAQKSFLWGGEVGYSFTVDDPILHADASTMTDAISRSIMSDASKKGLISQFMAYGHISQDVGAATNKATVNYQKSVARASRAVLVSRLTANVALNAADSIGSEVSNKINSLRTRLGSNYWPRLPYTKKVDLYLNNLRAYKKLHEEDSARVNATFGIYQVSSVAATLLDRDDDLSNSGVSSDRSQGDVITEIQWSDSVARTVDAFLLYEKQLEIGLASVVVNE